jgi:hypothetical protein
MKRGAALLACLLGLVIGCATDRDAGVGVPQVKEVEWVGEATLVINQIGDPDVSMIGTELFRLKTAGSELRSMWRNGREVHPFAFALDENRVAFATCDDWYVVAYAGRVDCKKMSGGLVSADGLAVGTWYLTREE